MDKIESQMGGKDDAQAQKIWDGLVKLRDGLLKEEKSAIDRDLWVKAFDQGGSRNPFFFLCECTH